SVSASWATAAPGAAEAATRTARARILRRAMIHLGARDILRELGREDPPISSNGASLPCPTGASGGSDASPGPLGPGGGHSRPRAQQPGAPEDSAPESTPLAHHVDLERAPAGRLRADELHPGERHPHPS